MNFFSSLREELYQQLERISVTHKHGRDLNRQEYDQIYKCLELLDTLETELTKCQLMKTTPADFIYQETLEKPETY
jgi:hypothetical protein